MKRKTAKRRNPRYMTSKTLGDGNLSYYYEPPKDAILAKIAERHALGQDWERAATRVMELNQRVDEWRKQEKGNPCLRETFGQFSVKALCEAYLESNNFQRLKDNTKRDYRSKINEIIALPIGNSKMSLGQVNFHEIKVSDADKIYSSLKIGKKGQPRITHANGIMRVLRLIFNLAKRWHDLPQNPFENPALESRKPRKIIWSNEQLVLFCETALDMGLISIYLAAMIGRETGLRVTDIRNLKWGDIGEDFIEISASKTDASLSIPITSTLKNALSEHRSEDDEFVLLTDGKKLPYTEMRLSQKFTTVRREAGLPEHLQLRDFRSTLLNELADAGATEDEVMAVSGHADRATLKHYVKPTKRRASPAYTKLLSQRNSG
tara:strand:+ start:119380 stop:120513 length:1134 start_codon:yes stop_codon:yes gene_type:complete